jgi:outer membrane lipoprotein carrier protein
MPGVKLRGIGRRALLAAMLLAGGALLGEEAALDRIVSRMEAFYRRSPGITADFVQIMESRTLGRPQEESGTLALKPPGKMRWDYRVPRGKIAITDGTHAYLYLPEDRQVIVGKMGDLDSGAVTPRLFLGGAPLSRDFQVEGDPAPERKGLWLLKLTPRARDFPYDAISLEVQEATGIIQSIRLLDSLGNRVEYRFEHVQVARNLPDRSFSYKIPRGVDIQVLGEGSSPPASP